MDELAAAYNRSESFRNKPTLPKCLPRCLAVIPARGGSKRVADKNIVDFFGKPILGYSLDIAGAADIFSIVHVSTDSLRVASVAKSFGFAPAFMRATRLADDSTGVWAVVRWVIEEYLQRGEKFDCVCLLSACMPLLEVSDLRGGLGYLLSLGRGYTVMACCEYLSSPVRALSLARDGGLEAIDRASFSHPRSQDLGSYVMDTGAFAYRWVADVMATDEALSKARAYILARDKGVDINTERDLEFAKLLYQARQCDKVD